MYTPDERQIYTDPTGRRRDPLELRRRLTLQSQGQLNEWIAAYNDGTEIDKASAEENLVRVTRMVFEFAGVADPVGVPDAVVLSTLGHFLETLESFAFGGRSTQTVTHSSATSAPNPFPSTISSNCP